MKTLLVIALYLLTGTGFLFSQEKATVTLTVEIEVSKHNKGSMLLALYNSDATYMKSSIRSSKVEVKNNKAVMVFENLPIGSYGFSYFHDLNDNGKLDKNFVGIPKEPYGFSNGEKGSFGPPDFDKIQFELTENITISVNVK